MKKTYRFFLGGKVCRLYQEIVLVFIIDENDMPNDKNTVIKSLADLVVNPQKELAIYVWRIVI